MIIGLTYDLRRDYIAEGYSEEDVAEFDSEETIEAIDKTIRELGYKTERIGNARALCKSLVAGKKWDLVFNVAEGVSGRCRESQVPAILELYGIGYTFSDPMVCAVTLDKACAKRMVSSFGLTTPKFEVVEKLQDAARIKLDYPLFAKPIAEGTGKGIDHNSMIESPHQLKEVCKNLLERYSQPVLVEEFLSGQEFTVGILGNGNRASVLGIMEIKIINDSKNGIYSYNAKEKCETLVKYLPYKKGEPIYKEVSELALESYKALQCQDAARVDIRCDRKSKPSFLEVNPLPGLHPTHSDLPMIATQEGMDYKELIGTIINNALERLN